MAKPLLLRIRSIRKRQQRQNGQLRDGNSQCSTTLFEERIQPRSDGNSIPDFTQAVWWTIADAPPPRMERETIGRGQVNDRPHANPRVPSPEIAKQAQRSCAVAGNANGDRICYPAPINDVMPAQIPQRSISQIDGNEHGRSSGEPSDDNHAHAALTPRGKATTGESRRLDGSHATLIASTIVAEGETIPQRRRNDYNTSRSLIPAKRERSTSQQH